MRHVTQSSAGRQEIAGAERKRLAAAAGGAGDAERLAALAGAERILARHALVALPRAPHREPQRIVWRETCRRLAERRGALRPWERNFVAGLPNFLRLSSKQRYILDEIARRVLGTGAAP